MPPPWVTAAFPEKVPFFNVKTPRLKTPPPNAAEFPKKVLFVTFNVPQLETPPPLPLTVFPERVLPKMLTVPVEERLNIPPPFGPELLEIVLSVTVTIPLPSFRIPPPDPDNTDAEFPDTLLLVTVSVP